MKKGKTRNKKVEQTVPTFKATIKVLGKLYTAEGLTVLEAIQNLKPDIGRGMSVLTVEHDGQRREKILNARLTASLFGKVSRLNKEMAFKHIKTFFG